MLPTLEAPEKIMRPTLLITLFLTALTFAAEPTTRPGSVLDFTVANIDGVETPLSNYRGKVVLIVNTASKCGLTKQYAELQSLYEKYSDQNFVILGFPCNDFNGQEPGSESDIKTFCTQNYGVTFDMFSKVAVKGEGRSPLYEFLISPQTNEKFAGEIKWNFTKFLVDREGKVVARFEPKVKPSDASVTAAIEGELAKK